MMKLTIFNSVIRHFSNVSALKGAFLKDPVWLDIQTGFIINLTEKNKTVKIHTQYTWPGYPNEICFMIIDEIKNRNFNFQLSIITTQIFGIQWCLSQEQAKGLSFPLGFSSTMILTNWQRSCKYRIPKNGETGKLTN